ncbi:MAG: hypothetical protein LUE87_11175 [Lachnospiraceae bacterium]|nr:hypothetical protein [Lachnospiraceae bacterium]
MHTVGRIDREIYKCVAENIRTDEVIITVGQIQHIEERHPNIYITYSKYLSQIVSEPDYILMDRGPDTAFILKQTDSGEKFQTILRLCTSSDPADYKNSIITFFKIDDKRWKRYLRTKKILYKRG